MLTTRITLSIAEASAEDVEALLMDEGIAYERRDQTTLVRAPAGRVLLSVFVPESEAPAERLRLAALVEAVPFELSEESLDADAGRDAWKAFFKPLAVGPFVIVPSWEQYTPTADQTVIALDPGRAFGTGGHASTRLCLRAVGRLPVGEGGVSHFLDVGCGSGVLGIACALRWPRSTGVAVDIDLESVAVTRENAEQNHVLGRIALPPDNVRALLGHFDVVLANLTAETLAELCDAIAARVARGGRLIASGILDGEAARTTAAFVARGLVLEHSDEEDEWRALTLRRPPARAGA